MLIEIKVRDGDKTVAAMFSREEYEDSTRISLADRTVRHLIRLIEDEKDENEQEKR